MGGDYTRFTFDPRSDYAGVLSQQGRVQVDADWNELVEILDRHWRAETVDLIGRSGVPANAPHGFELDWQGTNDLRIGRGRMYVDGLIAENHGTGTTEYEPLWDEPQGSTGYLLWSEQLYEPQWRLRPPFPSGAGPHLVYLDVWRRERTAADFLDLVDPALGVDTDTRLQTVWQVRFVADAGAGVKCSTGWDTIPAYRDRTKRSGARLTTQGLGVTDPSDPCYLSPTGGYRGRENRLYRVEIHDPAATPPLFKWSRDNGSVAANVLSINDAAGTTPRLVVTRIGRDAILRFHVNDWVEVLDDALEFEGVAGVLAQVDSVADASNTVWLKNVQATSSPAALTDISAARNARLRRWDQTDASGLVKARTTPVELEDGVFVAFDFTEGPPEVGDWWSFAARSITGKVEHLDNAPPRGVRHHYAPLGILHGPGVTPDDCRNLFPVTPTDCCDCDQCVSLADHESGKLTIQAAIDRVKAKGGKVCLQPGVYRLREPLVIGSARSVQLVGKGITTVLLHDREGPAIDIRDSHEVTIERLAVATSTSGLGKLIGSFTGAPPKNAPSVEVSIMVTNSMAVTIQRCLLAQSAPFFAAGAKNAAVGAASVSVNGGVGVGLAGLLLGLSIRHNVIMAETGVAMMAGGTAIAPPKQRTTKLGRAVGGWQPWNTVDTRAEKILTRWEKSALAKGVPPYLATAGLIIENNTLACWRVGIDLLKFAGAVLTTSVVLHAGETRLFQNSIYGCSDVGILLAGLSSGGVPLTSAVGWFGANTGDAVKSSLPVSPVGTLGGPGRVEITANLLAVSGVGIAVGSNAVRIAENDVALDSSRAASPDRPSDRLHGIVVFSSPRVPSVGELHVDGNRVHNAPAFGISVQARVKAALIKRNQISGAGICGIGMSAEAAVDNLAIEDNQIRATALELDDRLTLPVGIQVMRAEVATLARNEVIGVGASAFSARLRAGIHVIAARTLRISENDVRDVGPGSDFAGVSVGIEVEAPYETVQIVENTVRHPDFGAEGLKSGAWVGVLIGSVVDLQKVSDLRGVIEVTIERQVASGEEHPEAAAIQTAGEDVMHTALVASSTTADAARISPVEVREGVNEITLVGLDGADTIERQDTDVAVRGNILGGAGTGSALFVRTPGSCIASDNRCQVPDGDPSWAVVWAVTAGATIVSSNHADGRRAHVSMFVKAPAGHGVPAATVTGNITTGDILLNNLALAAPWAPLNVRW